MIHEKRQAPVSADSCRPHSAVRALDARALASAIGNRAMASLARSGAAASPASRSGRALQRSGKKSKKPSATPPGLVVVEEPAGGCGVCITPRRAGDIAHRRIQSAFSGLSELSTRILPSPTDYNGRLDLARPFALGWEIGEIKPANRAGMRAGVQDIAWYEKEIQNADEPGMTLAIPMDEVIEPASSPDLEVPFDVFPPDSPCVQFLYVNRPRAGVYTYYCRPTRSQLAGCCPEEEKKKKKSQNVKVEQLAFPQDLSNVVPHIEAQLKRLPGDASRYVIVASPRLYARLEAAARERNIRLFGTSLRGRPAFGYWGLGFTTIAATFSPYVVLSGVGIAGVGAAGTAAAATTAGGAGAAAAGGTGGAVIPISAAGGGATIAAVQSTKTWAAAAGFLVFAGAASEASASPRRRAYTPHLAVVPAPAEAKIGTRVDIEGVGYRVVGIAVDR